MIQNVELIDGRVSCFFESGLTLVLPSGFFRVEFANDPNSDKTGWAIGYRFPDGREADTDLILETGSSLSDYEGWFIDYGNYLKQQE